MTSPPSVVVRLFTRVGCTLCDPVKYILARTHRRYPFRYEEVDIGLPQHSRWHHLYTNDIPVVDVNGVELARHGLKETALLQRLEALGCKPIDQQPSRSRTAPAVDTTLPPTTANTKA